MSLLRVTRDVALALGQHYSPHLRISRASERVTVNSNPLRQTLAAIDGRRPVRAHGDVCHAGVGQIFERDMEE